MGTTLTGTKPKDTYDSLIKVTDNGPLTGSLKVLTDGLGNDSALALSTGAASVTGTLAVSSDVSIADKIIHTGDTNTAIRFPSVDTITFETSGVEAARINTLGNMGVGVVSPVAAKLCVQVASSATNVSAFDITNGANASFNVSLRTGITELTAGGTGNMSFVNSTERMRILSGGGLTFNGDTAQANALDDYEEGTWTPSLGGNTTYNLLSGTYTKIGRVVTVNFLIGVNTLGTGSASTISGLPFTVFASNRGAGGVAFVSAPSTGYASINPAVLSSTTTLVFATSTILGVWADQSNVFANGTIISGTVTYFA